MKAAVALGFLAGALTLGAVAPSAAVDPVPSFGPSTRYPVPYARGCGYCGHASAIADLNGDGRAEVVSVNGDETVSVFLARSGGGPGARRDYVAAGDPHGIALADVNRDGHVDVALADRAGFVTVFLNAGDGTLAARRDFAAGSGGASPMAIAAGDLDGDGAPDLVTANSGEYGGTPGVSVFRNEGHGTFGAAHDYPAGSGNPVSVAVGDLDGDHRPDVVAGTGDQTVAVFFNNGDGTLRAPREEAVGGAGSVALGDLNGDGKLDVATADGQNGVSVLLNAGDGSFEGSRTYPVLRGGDGDTAQPQSIAIGDLNGDRRPDLATANFDRHVSLLLNGGAGTFRPAIDLGGNCGYFYQGEHLVAIGDVNGDGRPDLAAAGDMGLCVSLGTAARRCNVQDVRGLTLAGAKVRLERGHCRLGRTRRAYARYVASGRVAGQTPGFGAVLRQGGRVDVVVSRGPRR
ncbi:MAG TPA: FG-GAP-like repeat-containing protein [Gaiellales bacterium]|nr:FG-GAP-like repeat-containing protein [Gaiellales bacterium]